MASSSGDDESGWEEEGEEATVPCKCLFCDVVLDGGPQLVLEHCSEQHSFDFKEYTRKMCKYRANDLFVSSRLRGHLFVTLVTPSIAHNLLLIFVPFKLMCYVCI